jgi:hypothetical protein
LTGEIVTLQGRLNPNIVRKVFKQIRVKIGQHNLLKEQSNLGRNLRLKNLDQAKRIGILYTLDDIPDYNKISDFVSELQHKHKDVKALGFVKNKNLITRFLPKLSFDFFSIRDLSWFYRPIHIKLKDFIEKEFDLLIDLSTYESFPLKYIAGLSHSLCKVGRFSEENSNYYDLMIDIKPSATLDDYIGQVRHYLTIINVDEKKN